MGGQVMTMMQAIEARDELFWDSRVMNGYFGNAIVDNGKEPLHVGGCSCPGCMAHDGGKQFQSGGGSIGAEDTIPASVSTTATLLPGGTQRSAIDSAGDSDWFRIELTAGQTYTFSTTLGGGGLRDSVLTLRNSSGGVITSNDDANYDAGLLWSEITFTATTTGTFYLDVAAYGDFTGEYYLSSTRPLADPVAGDASTTASLTLGADPTAGVLEQTGDRDWYAVTLEAGETYEFVTLGTGLSGDPDTTLSLRNASGSLLAFNDDSDGTYSRIRFIAETSGTYYLDVGGWANSQRGDYLVQARVAEPLPLFNNDQIADQLLNGYWGGPAGAHTFDVGPGGTISVNVSALTTEGQFLAREALNLWSDVLGVTFNEVASGAQIVFDDDQDGAFASVSRVNGNITLAEVNVSEAWLANSGTTLDSYSFQTFIHEIGHALGLGHGGNYNSTADYFQDASYLNDAWVTTVMSYFDQRENSYFGDLGYSRVYSITPRGADIVAIQTAYGVATTTRTDDTIYGVGNTSGRAVYGVGPEATNGAGNLLGFTIIDHGGNDTLDYSSFGSAQYINLNAETFSNVGGSVGNMSIARGTIIENAIGGSGGDTLIGNDVANILTGGLGNDIIDGGAEVDTAIVRGNRSQYTIVQTALGVFDITGPDGGDRLTGVEYLQFDDETIQLLRGTGISVNFANPASYQAAMDNIRDFDGNDLGGDGSWVRIGSADVDGDGDIDQILVNAEIGRFATVGAANDGLYYFNDHSWGGDVRVVGIYIDPLVQSGDVEPGSDLDSQYRFQVDLQNGNIGTVLGAEDYDGDGLQEVYFALTDGTAYLHAYMHADGNIQYANYQTEQQVIDFLTANGYDASTWAGWFDGSNSSTVQPDVDKGVPVSELPAASDPVAGGALDSVLSDLFGGKSVPVSEPETGLGEAGKDALAALDGSWSGAVQPTTFEPGMMAQPGHFDRSGLDSFGIDGFGIEQGGFVPGGLDLHGLDNPFAQPEIFA